MGHVHDATFYIHVLLVRSEMFKVDIKSIAKANIVTTG